MKYAREFFQIFSQLLGNIKLFPSLKRKIKEWRVSNKQTLMLRCDDFKHWEFVLDIVGITRNVGSLD